MTEKRKVRILPFRRTTRWLIIVALILAISILHYTTPNYQPFSHELFARFYYLPIIISGVWFGLKGGLGAGVLATLFYFPYLWGAWAEQGTVFWDKLLEVFLFNLAGLTVGRLSDVQQQQHERIQRLQTLAVLGQAAASVAHEMKNIVIPVRGFLRRIRRSNTLNDNARRYVDIVEREAARLEDMTKDMLTFARQAPIQTEPVEIRNLLERVRDNLRDEFQDKGVELVCSCPTDLTGALDADKMHQVFSNLLLNALQASAPGTEVRMYVEQKPDSIHIHVEDQGEGIPSDKLDRIFLPFFTTKTQGTGLGLALVQRTVEDHGGSIQVASAPGQGAHFSLTLPRSHP
jgi:two-component system sensor histidine kinase HydH